MKPEELKIYADFMKEYELDYIEVKKGDFSLIFGKKGEFYRYDIVRDDWQLLSTTQKRKS